MTTPDPLVCANLIAAGKLADCTEPIARHCASCHGCPNACMCPPLPAVGTQVLPKDGVRDRHGYPVPRLPHTVVATWDHRRDAEPDDYVIVAQLTSDVRYTVDLDQAVNTETGAYLGLDDIDIVDEPRITFTAKEQP